MPEVGLRETMPVDASSTGPDFWSKSAQLFADFLADTRPHVARYIEARIVSSPDYHSRELSILTGLVALGDAGDGAAARFAADREGRETLPENARRDDKSDKEWAKIQIRAQITRAFLDKDYARASFLILLYASLDIRDEIINELRDEAQELEVDIKAGSAGKAKTGLLNTTHTVQHSEFARTKTGKVLTTAGYLGSAVLSAYSGIMTGRKLKRGIAKARAGQAA